MHQPTNLSLSRVLKKRESSVLKRGPFRLTLLTKPYSKEETWEQEHQNFFPSGLLAKKGVH